MKGNYLEQLLSEWYQYQGYFVRKNVAVDRRPKGGYDSELDIVAYSPRKKHLVHFEASMDAASWKERELRFRKKFEAGDRNIPKLFDGLKLPKTYEKVAVLEYASNSRMTMIGGGRVVLVKEILRDILEDFRGKDVASGAVSEAYPILRTLQFIATHFVVNPTRPKSAGKSKALNAGGGKTRELDLGMRDLIGE